eukprot:8722660-Pyramimonas_sp.AAC.1
MPGVLGKHMSPAQIARGERSTSRSPRRPPSKQAGNDSATQTEDRLTVCTDHRCCKLCGCHDDDNDYLAQALGLVEP